MFLAIVKHIPKPGNITDDLNINKYMRKNYEVL